MIPSSGPQLVCVSDELPLHQSHVGHPRFADFAVEAKYDGQRGLAVLDRGAVTLLSRNGADITRTFPEITPALAASNRRMVLDWEIVAPRRVGRSFVQPFAATVAPESPRAELLRRVPVRYFVFDVLQADGHNLTREPYSARRILLNQIASASRGSVVQFPANWAGMDPAVVLEASAETGPGGHRLQAPGLQVHPGVAVTGLDQDAFCRGQFQVRRHFRWSRPYRGARRVSCTAVE